LENMCCFPMGELPKNCIPSTSILFWGDGSWHLPSSQPAQTLPMAGGWKIGVH
jgi:hypothetical protein